MKNCSRKIFSHKNSVHHLSSSITNIFNTDGVIFSKKTKLYTQFAGYRRNYFFTIIIYIIIYIIYLPTGAQKQVHMPKYKQWPQNLRKIKLPQFQAIRALLVTIFWICSHLQRCLHVALIYFFMLRKTDLDYYKEIAFSPSTITYYIYFKPEENSQASCHKIIQSKTNRISERGGGGVEGWALTFRQGR